MTKIVESEVYFEGRAVRLLLSLLRFHLLLDLIDLVGQLNQIRDDDFRIPWMLPVGLRGESLVAHLKCL